MLKEWRSRRGPDLYAIYLVEHTNRGFLRWENSKGEVLQRAPPKGHGHDGKRVPILGKQTAVEIREIEEESDQKPKFEF